MKNFIVKYESVLLPAVLTVIGIGGIFLSIRYDPGNNTLLVGAGMATAVCFTVLCMNLYFVRRKHKKFIATKKYVQKRIFSDKYECHIIDWPCDESGDMGELVLNDVGEKTNPRHN